MSLIAFPGRIAGLGTVHVVAADDGYHVSHQSQSGGSWGSFSGPYQLAETAIAAAYALARETYGGCAVEICLKALAEVDVGAQLENCPYQAGEF